ncbi:MAG: hypothetical protein J5J06_08875 [Phycisphaerae bacterium]|nr:hypothetical protein [Phycisphaerae bacterium]
MAVVVGIDEAGYGPMLGPLVVSGTAFRVPDDQARECLWTRLRRTCSRKPTPRGRKLAIADSKILYKPGLGPNGLSLLERAFLVMLATTGVRPRFFSELLEYLAPHALKAAGSQPWYAETGFALPLAPDTGDVGTRANAVLRDCREGGIVPVALVSETLLEDEFNRRLRATRNKAVVLLGQVLRVVERIRLLVPGESLLVHVDRLGGRVHYREWIGLSWPGNLSVLEEAPESSRYSVTCDGLSMEIDFTVGGENKHLPIALASIASKYVRELYMYAFNTYWSSKKESLRPTAGYFNDALRWIADAAELLERAGVDRASLVRER